MESSDEGKLSKSLNDIMYRRLKNRERQRRYRERKRLQADSTSSKPQVTTESSQLQIIPSPMNVIIEQVVTRVHCRRNWKKDARTAPASKQEVSPGEENHMPHIPSGARESEQTLEAQVYKHEEVRSKPGRRDWKAEARNKK